MSPSMGHVGHGNNDIWSLFIALFTRSNAREATKLLASGIAIEGGRRIFKWLADRVVPHPTVVLQFSQGDPAYDWVMLMLTEDNVWRRSLNFAVSAASTKRQWTVSSHFRVGISSHQEVDFVPNWDRAHLFRWQGYWVDVVRVGPSSSSYSGQMTPWGPGPVSPQSLQITLFTLKPEVAAAFVEEARLRYQKSNEAKVTIHLSDSASLHGPGGHVQWGNVKSKTRRERSTLALEPGVWEDLIEDVREFLDIEDWYTELGIPHHRGYLLHGPPGTGKTSTIYALAGELNLEIYSLSLASGQVDDAFLQRLVTSAPRGSIVLVEDIDCAFSNREDEEDGASDPFNASSAMMGRRSRRLMTQRVTLSGLLNVIDGVGSDEGRLFFATTNHFDRLDPALVRPGRIDYKIEYHRADASQALSLFERFFPANRFAPAGQPSFSIDSVPGPLPFEKETLTTQITAPPARYPYKGTLTRPIHELARAFAAAVPAGEFSAAELQGYLLLCKWDPERAVDGLQSWVEETRAERVRKTEREEARAKKSAAAAAVATQAQAIGVPRQVGGSLRIGDIAYNDPIIFGR